MKKVQTFIRSSNRHIFTFQIFLMNVMVRIPIILLLAITYTFLDGDTGCSLEDVMVFFSGAHQPPPLGFELQPSLTFNHQKGKLATILATASTCDLQIRLPTIHGPNYASFRDAMILSIKGNDGFGGV